MNKVLKHDPNLTMEVNRVLHFFLVYVYVCLYVDLRAPALEKFNIHFTSKCGWGSLSKLMCIRQSNHFKSITLGIQKRHTRVVIYLLN